MISSKEIQEFIMKHWLTKHYCPYVCPNFSSAGFEEMDVIAVTRTFQITDFEIKMSRSDFFADFKKVNKHLRYEGKFDDCQDQQSLLFWNAVRPNKFYYCCPKGLIKPEEVPKYAGLIHFTKFQLQGDKHPTVKFEVLKKAPFIHHAKCDMKVIAAIASSLSNRLILGCALMTWKNNRNKVDFEL